MGKVFPVCMCVRAYAWLCSITQSAGVSWWTHQSARQPLLVPDWLNYSPYVTLATLMSPGAPVSAEAWAKQSRSRYNHSTHATPHPSPGLIELITATLFTRRHTGQSIQPHGPQPRAYFCMHLFCQRWANTAQTRQLFLLSETHANAWWS